MSYQISLTVDAWMRFIDVDLAYFTNLENLPGRKRTPVMLISEINKEIEDLLVLRKNLDHQRDLLHGLSQKVREPFTLIRRTKTQERRVLTCSVRTIAGERPPTQQQSDCSTATEERRAYHCSHSICLGQSVH